MSAVLEPFMTDQVHLVVATPCFGGQVSGIYAGSNLPSAARCWYLAVSLKRSVRSPPWYPGSANMAVAATGR